MKDKVLYFMTILKDNLIKTFKKIFIDKLKAKNDENFTFSLIILEE